MEEAEDAVRSQLGSGSARVPDLPQYIISKLGLNKNLLETENTAELDELDQMGIQTDPIMNKETETNRYKKITEESIGMQIARNAPKEEDFESIRVF